MAKKDSRPDERGSRPAGGAGQRPPQPVTPTRLMFPTEPGRYGGRPRRRRSLVRRLVLVVLLGVLAFVGVMAYLFKQMPSDYRDPDTISDEQFIEWANDFADKVNKLSERDPEKETFDITITEDEVNGVLASFSRPEVRQAVQAKLNLDTVLELSEEFSGLMIRFTEGEMTVMARYEGSKLRPVVSIIGRPLVHENGEVGFKPTGLRMGRMPVPADWVKSLQEMEALSFPVPEEIRLEEITARDGELQLVGKYLTSGPVIRRPSRAPRAQ